MSVSRPSVAAAYRIDRLMPATSWAVGGRRRTWSGSGSGVGIVRTWVRFPPGFVRVIYHRRGDNLASCGSSHGAGHNG